MIVSECIFIPCSFVILLSSVHIQVMYHLVLFIKWNLKTVTASVDSVNTSRHINNCTFQLERSILQQNIIGRIHMRMELFLFQREKKRSHGWYKMVKVLRQETHSLVSLLNYEQQRHKSIDVLSRESSDCRVIGYPSLYLFLTVHSLQILLACVIFIFFPINEQYFQLSEARIFFL